MNLRLAIVAYFAGNLDDGLRAIDMAVKFGVPAKNLYRQLNELEGMGWIAAPPGDRHRLYEAGPELRRLLGVA